MERLNLQNLSRRTGISQPDLEQVVSQQLYPDRTWYCAEGLGNGQFEEITCILIAMAASLLDAGLRPEAVSQVMKALAEIPKPGRNSLRLPILAHAVTEAANAVVQVSERRCVRWKLGTSDSGWIRCGKPQLVAEFDHEPKVVVAIDVAHIGELVRGGPSAD